MLVGIIYFEEIRAKEVLKTLFSFPVPLRPISYSEDEEPSSKNTRKFNEGSAKKILSQPPQKYFLSSDFCRYNFLLRESYAALFIDNFSSPRSSSLDLLIEEICNMNPFFGCICEGEERDHRNRVVKVIGKNTIESWVGRNPFKKVPGLYWKTIFSKQILLQNNLKIEKLKKLAKHSSTLKISTVVLTFFDDPQDWRKYAEALDSACNSLDGIFSKEQVLAETSHIENVMQYITAISKFK